MYFSCCCFRFGSSLHFVPDQRFLSETCSRDVRTHAARRHHRRQPWNLGWDEDDWTRTSVLEKRQTNFVHKSVDDRLVLTLDFKDIRNRAADAARNSLQKLSDAGSSLASESLKTWQDLKTSVSVQKDMRIVIALRSSTVNFIGRAALGFLGLIVLVRVFVKVARKYRWGWEEAQGAVRRDRSLGGREVVVSEKKKSEQNGLFALKAKAKIQNPLDEVEASRSERSSKALPISWKPVERIERSGHSLPKWWPKPSLSTVKPTLQAQIEANNMVQGIMNKRVNGADFTEEDMLKIRQICRESGAKVSFDSSNTRDSFYRAAINFALSTCSRSANGSSAPSICNESVVEFIAGLAEDIGLDAKRAATMANAAVAARTRSSFVQAWALSLQGNFTGAQTEITKLVQIHAVFRPEANSPEMEMVGKALESTLDVDERKELFQIYKKAGCNALEAVAMEALGLPSLKERR